MDLITKLIWCDLTISVFSFIIGAVLYSEPDLEKVYKKFCFIGGLSFILLPILIIMKIWTL